MREFLPNGRVKTMMIW